MGFKSRKRRQKMDKAVGDAAKAVDFAKRAVRKTSAETPAALARELPAEEKPMGSEKAEEPKAEPVQNKASAEEPTSAAKETVEPEPAPQTEAAEPEKKSVAEVIHEEETNAKLQEVMEALHETAEKAETPVTETPAKPAERQEPVNGTITVTPQSAPQTEAPETPAKPAERQEPATGKITLRPRPAAGMAPLLSRWRVVESSLETGEQAAGGAEVQASTPTMKVGPMPQEKKPSENFFSKWMYEIGAGLVAAVSTFAAATSSSLYQKLGTFGHLALVMVGTVVMTLALTFHVTGKQKAENQTTGGSRTAPQNRDDTQTR